MDWCWEIIAVKLLNDWFLFHFLLWKDLSHRQKCRILSSILPLGLDVYHKAPRSSTTPLVDSLFWAPVAFPAFRHFCTWRADFAWALPFDNWQHHFLPAGPAGLKASSGQEGEQMVTLKRFGSRGAKLLAVSHHLFQEPLAPVPPKSGVFSLNKTQEGNWH